MRGDRLADARRRAGLSQKALADRMNTSITRQGIGNVEQGRSGILMASAVEAARILDVSLDYLTGLTDNPAPAQWLDRTVRKLQRVETRRRSEGTSGTPPVRLVPFVHGAGVAAGAGGNADDEHVLGHVPFRTNWLARRRIDPERCSVIEVVGDSMEPTLQNGSVILVDHRRTEARDDRIFCIRTDDGPVVKRLRRRKNAWELTSDNYDYPPRPWPPEAGIIGQVIWTGRSL